MTHRSSTADIEEDATSAVRARFRRIPGLRAKVSENDKTPIYDGYIVFNDSVSGSNTGYKGYVHLQVKGTEVDKFDEDICGFKVRKTDLQAFHSDGGALFFVVQIEKESGNTRIFYQSFSALNAGFIISSMSADNSVKLDFHVLPDDDGTVSRIVHMLKDSSSDVALTAVSSASRVQPESVTLQSARPINVEEFGDITIIDLTQGHQRMLTSMDGMLIPSGAPYLAISRQASNEPRWQDASIGAGDAVYYHQVGSHVGKDAVFLHVGPLILNIGKDAWKSWMKNPDLTPHSQDVKISIHIGTVPDDALHDIRFLQAVRKNGGIVENNHDTLFRITVNDEDMWKDLDRLLVNVDKLKRLLEQLGISTKQDTGSVNEQAFSTLYQGIIEDRSFPVTTESELGVRAVHLGNHLVGVVYMRMDDAEDTYHILDMFDTGKLVVMAQHDSGITISQNNSRYITSVFSTVDSKSLAQISNLHEGSVVESFQKAFELRKRQPVRQQECIKRDLLQDANYTVLRMVQAADTISRNDVDIPDYMKLDRWKTLLNTAGELNQWIDDFEPSDDPVSMINRMQIKFRISTLNDRDKNSVRRLLAKSKQHDIRLGCYLLLGRIDEANNEKSQLSQKDENQQERYPIYNLFHPQEVQPPVIIEPEDMLPPIVKQYSESTPAQKRRLVRSGRIKEIEPAIYTVPNHTRGAGIEPNVGRRTNN